MSTQQALFDSPTTDTTGPATSIPMPTLTAVPVSPTRLDRTEAADLVVVDGNSVAHRAYHAYRSGDLRDDAGNPTWALYGFLALLGGILDKVRTPRLLIAFDAPNTFRRDSYAEYKAGRSEKDAELVTQLAALPGICERVGLAVCVADRYEADDVVASAATAGAQRGWRVVVASSDRDLVQLIDDGDASTGRGAIALLRLRSGLDNAEWLDATAATETFGCAPGRYIELAALRGDTSDNLPGARGIGAKTAPKCLEVCDHINDIVADPDAYKAALKSAAAKIAGASTEIARNLELMALVCDLDVDLDAYDLPADPGAVAGAFTSLGFSSLAGRAANYCGPVTLAAVPDLDVAFPADAPELSPWPEDDDVNPERYDTGVWDSASNDPGRFLGAEVEDLPF